MLQTPMDQGYFLTAMIVVLAINLCKYISCTPQNETEYSYSGNLIKNNYLLNTNILMYNIRITIFINVLIIH